MIPESSILPRPKAPSSSLLSKDRGKESCKGPRPVHCQSAATVQVTVAGWVRHRPESLLKG